MLFHIILCNSCIRRNLRTAGIPKKRNYPVGERRATRPEIATAFKDKEAFVALLMPLIILGVLSGLMTSPLGACLFVACWISKLTIERISHEIFPFIIVEILVLILITFVPAIPMFLPKLMGYY